MAARKTTTAPSARKTAKTAAPQNGRIKLDVDERAARLPVEFLECRDGRRHRLSRTHAPGTYGKVMRAGVNVLYVRRQCEICGTIRIDYYNLHSVEKETSKYEHPEGYRFVRTEDDQEAPDPLEFRKAFFVQAFPDIFK